MTSHRIDRHEGQPCARRRRHAGIEAGGLVGLLRRVDAGVEARQPERAADGERQCRSPAESAAPFCSDHRNRISAGAVPKAILSLERIQLRAELALRAEQAGDPAVHPVEHAGDARSTPAPAPNSPPMAKLTPVKPKHSARAVIALGIIARNGIRRGSRVFGHWLSPSARHRCRPCARMVSPAIARCPSSTRGDVPGGQIDVDAAAEADQADALSRFDDVALRERRRECGGRRARRSG